MNKKNCPLCHTEKWDYDIVNEIGTWCEPCHRKAKEIGFFMAITKAYALLSQIREIEKFDAQKR